MERLTNLVVALERALTWRPGFADAIDTVERFQGQGRDIITASYAGG